MREPPDPVSRNDCSLSGSGTKHITQMTYICRYLGIAIRCELSRKSLLPVLLASFSHEAYFGITSDDRHGDGEGGIERPCPMGGGAALQMWVRGLYVARSSFPTPNHEIKP